MRNNFLEWRVVAHNSRDPTALEEVSNSKIDGHADNQKRFNLPSRLIAKVFLFRTIYCPLSIIEKTAYAFSVDNDFKNVGGRKFWYKAIEAFYDKYSGLVTYHNKLIQQATLNGYVESESGRIYEFEPRLRRGEMQWPVSDIVNYPVQGFGGDLMQIARVSAKRRIDSLGYGDKVKFINSVHDSIVLDSGLSLRENIKVMTTMKQVFRDIPANFKKIYGSELLVPMDCECSIGTNWLWQHNMENFIC